MLIRSLRNFGKIYDQQHYIIPDSVEILRSSTIVDFGGADCEIEMDCNTPDFIFLSASIHPIYISNTTKLIRNENGKNHEIQNIYDSKFFSVDSEVKSHFCSSIKIYYEDNGYFILDNRKEELHEKIGANFRLNFSKTLLQIDFDHSNVPEIFEKSINQKIVEEDHTFSSKFYPYGGFYFYGCHPAQIEQCVFRSIFEHQHLRVKSYSFSSLLNKNIDIRKNTERFKKVNFSAAPSLSLYDKLKDGGCRIQLITYDEKIIPYQSVSASHIAGTNLITIKFKRGNNELF